LIESISKHLSKVLDEVYPDRKEGYYNTIIWQWCYYFGIAKDITLQGNTYDSYWMTQLTGNTDRRIQEKLNIWLRHIRK